MKQSACGLYAALEGVRDPFLRRAREAAQLTIPRLLTEEGRTGSTELYTPFQGLGARGSNNLASKLLLTLFPPNAPFFRLVLDSDAQALVAGVDRATAETEQSLAKIEKIVSQEVERQAMRPRIFEALKHLVVCGNALVYMAPAGGLRVFHLDQYVVDRDPMGEVLTIVTKEMVNIATLPEALYDMLDPRDKLEDSAGKMKDLALYTAVHRTGADKFEVWQEIQGAKVVEVPGSAGSYKTKNLPWIPLRLSYISDEAYGRGHVEEYIGDLKSLEGLSQALVEAAAAAARMLFLVNPNGLTMIEDLAGAPNGAFREGMKDDVTTLQLEKGNDLRVAFEQAGTIERRLSFAFLLNTSVQRNAERVTAEEVRYMAQELEDALGGVYSILAQEFQLPLVRLLMSNLVKRKELPKLEDKYVTPVIITGLEALGRGQDLNRLQLGLTVGTAAIGPEAMAMYLNPGNVLTRIFTAVGVATEGMVKTDQEVQAMQQQQQQQATMQSLTEKLGPEAMKQMGGAQSNG